jgi:hypothetical protein
LQAAGFTHAPDEILFDFALSHFPSSRSTLSQFG